MFRYAPLLICFLSFLIGCSTPQFSAFSNPFDRKGDADDPFYRETKAAKIDEIRQLTQRASSMSPAEQMQSATTLIEKVRAEDDPVIKEELVLALAYFQSPASIEGLRMAMQDSRPRIRKAACQSLGSLNSRESMRMLADVIQSDSNLDVRHEATRILGKSENPDAIPALSIALNDPDPALQYLAVQSLRQVHGKDLGNNMAVWRDFTRRYSENGSTEMIASAPEEDFLR